MTIGLGGVISPGNSPGTPITGSQTWNDGGSYLWEINASDIDGGGTKGTDPGWDWLDITGTLDLANLSAGGFTIDIDSLTAVTLPETQLALTPGPRATQATLTTASSLPLPQVASPTLALISSPSIQAASPTAHHGIGRSCSVAATSC